MARGEKALLKLGYECNNNCLICHASGNELCPSLSTQEAINKIALCKSQGIDFILFSGGEPTIRNDLPALAKFIKKSKMHFGLITNARMLSYKDYARKLASLNLRYVYASFYSANKNIHNSITNADSFEQSIKGIRNIAGEKGVELIVNIPITKLNAGTLKDTINLLIKNGVKKAKLSLFDVKGSVLKNKGKVIMPISIAAERAGEAAIYGERKGLKMMIGGFPLCLIAGLEHNLDDFETQGIKYMSESFEPHLFLVDHEDKTKTQKCAGCEKSGACIGIDKNYISLFGDDELRPFKKISNSAFFEFARGINEDEAGNIRIKENEILLEDKKRLFLFSYNHNDFSEGELEKIRKKGQVYTEKGQKCIKQRGKDAYISSSSKDARFENAAINEISSLKGSTLDIGCGNLYFYPIIREIAEEKKIIYTGIDPLKVKIKNRNMEFLQKRFEDVKFKDNSFNNILMLGSYNHVQDIMLVLKEAYRILKPKGTLLVSDDESVIILGKEKNKAKKEFEHYRNHSAQEAEKNLKKIGFKITRKIPVSKESGNRWFIRCEK